LDAETHDAASGTVVDIDEGLARVLIGPDDEEWFFPLTTLPPGSGVGTAIMFTRHDGRYTVLGLARSATTSVERSIEDRLSRPISMRRTADIQASDLRAALGDS
jgi:hypothetical protein